VGDTNITVIGAGPVGSLLALLLARRGFEVVVYERRPDMRAHQVSAGRSINLAVSTRGLHALHEVGLDAEVLQQAVPMLGRQLHSTEGKLTFLRYGQDDREFINSMSRGDLNKLLMSHAEATGKVQIEFGQRLIGCDLERGRIELRNEETGAVTSASAGVLIGTDGSASALRAAMSGAGDISITNDLLDAGYKELTMPPAPGNGLGPQGIFALEPNALHIWPRGKFMLIALPNRDGSFTCTLFLPFTAPAGEPSFEGLTTSSAVRELFASQFSDAVPHLPALEEQFLAAPLGQMATVKVSAWSRGPAVVLGDAAHAIVPFFGQGMNAGFEDCTVLGAMLDQRLSLARRMAAEAGQVTDSLAVDWTALFSRFCTARKPDTDAIADLAVENFVEMRDKVADREFLLWKGIEAELQRRFPGEYLSRYQLVTFTRVPYRVALEAGTIQTAILREVGQGKERADQVDYDKARALLHSKLRPLLRRHGLLAAPA